MQSKRRGCLGIFFAVIAAAAIVALRSTDWLASLGGCLTGARLDRVRRSPEYRDGKFRNPEPTRMTSGSYREMFRRQFFGREKREPARPIPVIKRVTADYAKAPASELRATWIGWASVLVEIDGRIILTDPVSWVVKGPRHRIFFSGDSGYSAAFASIGAQHGPFDLTLIKIGASDPMWSEIHMTPEEAVQTHRDLRGRVMLPVHWGTFNLAFHAWRDPADRAVAAAAKSGVQIVVPKPGEFVEPSAVHAPPEAWWDQE